nr:ATP-binding protein [Bradyrhizobium canariense]
MRRRWVSADREFLKIVIFNLIDNAVKYSFQDRHLTIELSFLKSNRWRFEVQNVGVPIDEDERQKIFDPWVRSFRQYLATRRPGTGLGLAVSQRILLAHDDTAVFDFESELISKRPPTATTSFFFELDAKGKGEASRS